jgi:hypothetical protein
MKRVVQDTRASTLLTRDVRVGLPAPPADFSAMWLERVGTQAVLCPSTIGQCLMRPRGKVTNFWRNA